MCVCVKVNSFISKSNEIQTGRQTERMGGREVDLFFSRVIGFFYVAQPKHPAMMMLRLLRKGENSNIYLVFTLFLVIFVKTFKILLATLTLKIYDR